MFTDLATCGSNLGVPFQEQEVTLTEQNVILTRGL